MDNPLQSILWEHVKPEYVRTIATNGDIYYTEEFYYEMNKLMEEQGLTAVEAYTALGFDTDFLIVARANSAGTRATKKAANRKLFEKNIADYDSDTTFEEMLKRYHNGEITKEDLYANMAARLIVLEEMQKELKKKVLSKLEQKK